MGQRMIITCDECESSFSVNDSLIKDTGSKVRCSKCDSVFVAYPKAAEDIEALQTDDPDLTLDSDDQMLGEDDDLGLDDLDSDLGDFLDEDEAEADETLAMATATEESELDLDDFDEMVDEDAGLESDDDPAQTEGELELDLDFDPDEDSDPGELEDLADLGIKAERESPLESFYKRRDEARRQARQ